MHRQYADNCHVTFGARNFENCQNKSNSDVSVTRKKTVKMCKHCHTEEKRRTKLYTDHRKKGGKGEHKGVHWTEAVNQTKEL